MLFLIIPDNWYKLGLSRQAEMYDQPMTIQTKLDNLK